MTQVDASIYNAFGSKRKSPEEFLAERQALEGNALGIQSARTKMAQEQESLQRQGQLRNMLAGGADANALMRSGFLDEGMKLSESTAKASASTAQAKKYDADTFKTNAEAIGIKAKQFYEQIGRLSSPQQAQALLSAAFNDEHLGPIIQASGKSLEQGLAEVPTDPVKFRQWQMLTADGVSKLEKHALDVRQQNEVERNNRTQNAISRGNLAVSQGNLAARLAGGGGAAPSGGKAPSGYRYTADGSLEPIPGGPAEIKADERNLAKQAGISSVNAQIAVIDKALAHPGRKTATGLSGTIDPRNYIPGTDSADFQSVLDQIGGTAFLQAFESLKGGGQITEVEGKKATDAIARLSRKQSDAEFEKSLQDLRSVMELGKKRLLGSASMTPQDKQALDWANSNPGDPRAAKIKQKLGM